ELLYVWLPAAVSGAAVTAWRRLRRSAAPDSAGPRRKRAGNPGTVLVPWKSAAAEGLDAPTARPWSRLRAVPRPGGPADSDPLRRGRLLAEAAPGLPGPPRALGQPRLDFLPAGPGRLARGPGSLLRKLRRTRAGAADVEPARPDAAGRPGVRVSPAGH